MKRSGVTRPGRWLRFEDAEDDALPSWRGLMVQMGRGEQLGALLWAGGALPLFRWLLPKAELRVLVC